MAVTTQQARLDAVVAESARDETNPQPQQPEESTAGQGGGGDQAYEDDGDAFEDDGDAFEEEEV